MDQFFAKRATAGGPSFCPHCGTILDLPETNNIVCSSCGYTCQYQDLPTLCTVTFSEDRPEPKWVKNAIVSQEVTGPARATVEEPCPKCNNPQMEFYTMQLRSADEGQTVFYECKKCGHRYSVNT
ncbi:DNA-directed RNA polymerase I subunit RPA12 [Saprolegnia diclina VS20]|uniref:DNA-directed RNA polymerase subunit n=2 Tax=Saprolegnia TaxID=4769 RepID=A0A067CLZ5_SAPPC|nr:DNA-directed RNA polymerase I subunit RPA12 [Saprolegnia diclina VS20]XP_012197455.1 hypothetical protein SPRG_03477 [Saprolegnia parasitica CBS 223.65]EQC37074.1 DNA-directed RNA polymerase I subunit RPA12 [Saprolegnia diclina VS20]KDO31548.1 hypothetical protein SPRG_03477 [Saprolegnia parasitica CBS 223.65]|eukprot:XP_008609236.1 DNA-directed RNA polymerase I subunit RPA12 [Saprolegnia diclina VS20]